MGWFEGKSMRRSALQVSDNSFYYCPMCNGWRMHELRKFVDRKGYVGSGDGCIL
jgi:hypothetical protein